MKEFKKNASITGVLVKNGLEETETKKGKDCIMGNLVLRTDDGSEHEIFFYSNKWKKENGEETSETSYFYNQYKDAMDNLVSLETAPIEECSVVRISDGTFTVEDYEKDGSLRFINKLSGKFINVVEKKDLELTKQEAKFEVEGIVESIEDEIIKDVPTGDLIINLSVIDTELLDSKGNFTFDKKAGKVSPSGLIPMRLKVDKEMAQAFRSAGYYEGCIAKFVGQIINNVTIEKVIEKQSFGEDIEREVKTTIRKYLIKSGNTPKSTYELEITDEVLTMLRAKRKEAIAESLAKKSSNSEQQEGTFGGASQPTPPTSNPFAGNPFA